MKRENKGPVAPQMFNLGMRLSDLLEDYVEEHGISKTQFWTDRANEFFINLKIKENVQSKS